MGSPGGNILGSISIIVSADTSKLQSDFARAQAIAAQSGAQISASLNAGVTPGIRGASIAFGQYAQAAEVAAGATRQETAALDALKTEFADLQGIEAANIVTSNAFAASVRQVGNAHAAAVPQMAAASAAVRTVFGEQSIRAVERFITLIPGVGAALQYAFPVVGALALLEMLDRVIDKATGLKKAEEELKRSTEEADRAFAHFSETANQFTVEHVTAEFGKARGIAAQGFFDKQKLAADQEALDGVTDHIKILQKAQATPGRVVLALTPIIGKDFLKAEQDQVKALQQDARALAAQVLEDKARIAKTGEDQPRAAVEETGALAAVRLSNQERALTAETEAKKRALDLQVAADHAVEQIRIAGIRDTDTRELESARESIRTASQRADGIRDIEAAALPERIALINQLAAAEAAGKDLPARRKIEEERKGKVEGAETQSRNTELDAAQHVFNAVTGLEVEKGKIIASQANDAALAWDEAYSRIDDAATKTEDAIARAAETNAVARVRVIETTEKSKGTTDELTTIQKKLQLEQQYSLQVGHTGAQQVAYAKQIETIDAQARADRIAGAQAALDTAIANSKDIDADQNVARLRADVAKLRGEADNAAIAAATKRLELEQRLTLEYRLRSALNRAVAAVPGAVGGAVAKGVFDGKGIGRDIRDELKGIGQQLLGNILSALITKIGLEIAAHTILGAIFTSSATAQVTAETANTVAVSANTAALVASKAAGVAGGIAGAAGGAASGAGGAVSAASSVAGSASLVGPLISAAGGIIGGAISAFATWVGDNKIVKAVNATTAAVLSLKGSPVAAGSTAGGVPGGSTINPATGQASSGSVVSDIGRKLFGSDNTAAGTPVRIVGIGAASAGGVGGLLEGIFGFGGGDALPVRIVDAGPLGQGGIGGIIGKVLGGFLGFAEGGDPPTDRPSFVGEKGKEIFWPKAAGTIIPNHKVKDYTSTAAASVSPGLDFTMPFVGLPAPNPVNSLLPGIGGNSRNGDMHFHGNMTFNGVQNVRQLMREISIVAKNQSPGHSPYASR